LKALLEKLGIKEINPGACSGAGRWMIDPQGSELISNNPTNGEEIAKVIQATPATYEKVMNAATEGYKSWCNIPAPKRGDVVRDLGNALREYKEPLGDLVSLEMGKIRGEGSRVKCRR
jgi:aldehyde dehydrogenase (NAD+)